jgi:hypothetical protein
LAGTVKKDNIGWSGGGRSGSPATNTWYYDLYRGWLTNKLYAEGKGTLYSNSPAGRLARRIWARGTNTVYSYNDAGDLDKIDYSSYGLFHIHVIDLDGDGSPEFLFVLGNGRGTSAREETLYVTHLTKRHFQDVLSAPISGFYGPGAEWRYAIEYRERNISGTVPLVLRLRVSSSEAPANADRDLVPIEVEKTILWGPSKRGVGSALRIVNATPTTKGLGK